MTYYSACILISAPLVVFTDLVLDGMIEVIYYNPIRLSFAKVFQRHRLISCIKRFSLVLPNYTTVTDMMLGHASRLFDCS